jgi:hypothetical protein
MAARAERGFVRKRGRLDLRRKPDCFLSHSSGDKSFVRKLADNLTRVGVDVWLDEWEMEAGDSLRDSLGIALEKSKYVCLVISPKMVKSEWCRDEIVQALAIEKRRKSKVVIPLLHKKAIPPPFIEDRLYVDFSKNFFAGLAELSRIVHGLSRVKFMRKMASRSPQNIADVWSILSDCGWDRESLFEPEDIDELRRRLDSGGLKYEKGKGGSVWLSDDIILRRPELSDLKVISTMRKFFPHSAAGANIRRTRRH